MASRVWRRGKHQMPRTGKVLCRTDTCASLDSRKNILWSQCLNTERIPDSLPSAESAAEENREAEFLKERNVDVILQIFLNFRYLILYLNFSHFVLSFIIIDQNFCTNFVQFSHCSHIFKLVYFIFYYNLFPIPKVSNLYIFNVNTLNTKNIYLTFTLILF